MDEKIAAKMATELPKLLELIREMEGAILTFVETLGEAEGVDKRMAAIARTQMEFGFFALGRSIQPLVKKHLEA